MTGFYYSHGTYPVFGSQSNSPLDKSEWDKIQTGFDKIAAPTGYGNYLLKYNNAESGIAASNVSVTDAGVMTVTAGLTVSAGTSDFSGTTTRVATLGAVESTTKAASSGYVATWYAPLASPALTGIPTVPTATAGTATTQAASCAFVASAGLTSALPGQLGNAGKSVITDGSNASWGVLSAIGGGTGQSSYTVGDILYASTTTALSKLAAGAQGKVIVSAGAGLAPIYGNASVFDDPCYWMGKV